MSQFNIINGLRDIFDDTCTRQVVSCLIRNSLIWDFLAEEKNFRETKKIIGNNQNNWTISKIVQAAAGFNNVYEIKEDPNLNYSIEEINNWISNNIPIERLSEIAFRIQASKSEFGLENILDKICQKEHSRKILHLWATIFSVCFVEENDKKEFINVFLINLKDITRVKLFSEILYTDSDIYNYFLKYIKDNSEKIYLSPIIFIIKELGKKENGKLAIKIAERLVEHYSLDKLQFSSSDSIIGLLNLLEKKHNLAYLYQLIGDGKTLEIANREIKNLSEELNNQFENITDNKDVILDDDSFNNERESNNSSEGNSLIRKIRAAKKVIKTDFCSGKLLTQKIYQEFLNPEKIIDSINFFSFGRDNEIDEIIELLDECGLVQESDELLQALVEFDPVNSKYLQHLAILNHKHGNQDKAVEIFRRLENLDKLAREEKLMLAESLEYCGEWSESFKIREKINFVSYENVQELVICAYRSGYKGEFDNIFEGNPFHIRESGLYKVINLLCTPKIEEFKIESEITEFWNTLKNDSEKILFIEHLRNNHENGKAIELLEKAVDEQQNNLPFVNELINIYQDGRKSENILTILKKIKMNGDVKQDDFERILEFLFTYKFNDKVKSILADFEQKWQLSIKKNTQTARIYLLENKYAEAQKLLSVLYQQKTSDQDLLVDFLLAQLKCNSMEFPIGLEVEKLHSIDEVKRLVRQNTNSNNIILRIIDVEFFAQNKIERYSEFLEKKSGENEDSIWRIKAAIGLTHFRENRFDLAIQLLKEVQRILPFNAKLLNKLLAAYLKLKLWKEAEVILYQILSIEGFSPILFAQIDQQMNCVEEWRSFLDRQIQVFPESKELRILFALALIQNEKNDEAARIVKELLKLSPLNNEYYLISAQILIDAGDPDYAEYILDIFFSNAKALGEAEYLAGAFLYERLGKFEQSLVMVNSISIFNEKLKTYKVGLLAKTGQLEEAIRMIDKINLENDERTTIVTLPIVTSPTWNSIEKEDSYIYRFGAKLNFQTGNLEKAITLAYRGLRLFPMDEALVAQYLGLLFLSGKSGSFSEVLGLADLEKSKNLDLICQLGESALISGEEINAANHLSHCIKLGEDNPRVKALQSRLLLRNGNYDEAKFLYKELKKEYDINKKKIFDSNNEFSISNEMWLAQAAIDFKDYRTAMDLSIKEIETIGPYLVFLTTYLESYKLALEANLLMEKLGVRAHLFPVLESDYGLLIKIKQDYLGKSQINSKISDLMDICIGYISKDRNDLEKVRNRKIDKENIKAFIFANFQLSGIEKMEISINNQLMDQEDKLFVTALLIDKFPEKSNEYLKGIIGEFPSNPLGHAILAILEEKSGNYSDAYAALTLALSHWPEEYEWEKWAGELSKKKGDLITALKHFENANRLSNGAGNNQYFEEIYLLTESEKAIQILEKKLAADPDNFNLLIRLGTLCNRYNKPGKAVIFLEDAKRIKPFSTLPLLLLSEVAEEFDNLEKAQQYIDSAISINPAQQDLLVQKAKIIQKAKGVDESLSYIEEELISFPGSATKLQIHKAYLLFREKGIHQAISFLESLPENTIENFEIENTRIKFYLYSGKIQIAQSLADKVLSMDPANPVTIALNGEIASSLGDLDRAIDLYIRAIQINPFEPSNYLLLFDIYNERRDFDSAINTLEKGIKANPAVFDLIYQSALYYYQHGLIAEAEKRIHEAIRINPHSDQANTIARLLKTQNALIGLPKESVAI